MFALPGPGVRRWLEDRITSVGGRWKGSNGGTRCRISRGYGDGRHSPGNELAVSGTGGRIGGRGGSRVAGQGNGC